MSRRFPALFAASMLLAACTMQRMQPPAKSQQFDDHMAHMSAADMRAPMLMNTRPAGTEQGTAGLPASNNAAEARLKASPRHAEWVKIAWEPGSSDSIMAWIVYPSSRAKAPVVVVVHEIFGLSTWVRGVADQVAADGFIAIAPDFLSRVRGGATTTELAGDSARKLIAGYTDTDRNKVILASANFAMSQPSAEQRYAVIGYCWGGATTFTHAVNGGVKGFSGGVAFYGLPYMTRGQPATADAPAKPGVFVGDTLSKIKAPLMLLSGSKDTRITAAMPALDSMMKALGKDYSGTNYDGAVHGFLRAQDDPKATRDPAEEAANLTATKDGWPRTVVFLRKILAAK